MSKPAGLCIFCGKTGVTDEHLFSKWLKAYFPRTAKDTHSFGTIVWEPARVSTIKQKQGHSGSRKVRKVCKCCNETWISGLDNSARQIVPTIFDNKPETLTIEMQTAISAWFCKIAMVGDSSQYLKEPSVSQAQRTWLKENRIPPEGTEIWVGSYGGTEWSNLAIYQRRGNLNIPLSGPRKLVGKIETTMIGMRHLLALVITTDIERLRFNLGTLEPMLIKIWPVTKSIFWPSLHLINDFEAGEIAGVLNIMRAYPIGTANGS